MDQVKIRASVAAHGLRKHDEVTVAATPAVEGAIKSGVFVELERIPETPLTQAILDDEAGVEMPEADEPKPKPRARGNG